MIGQVMSNWKLKCTGPLGNWIFPYQGKSTVNDIIVLSYPRIQHKQTQVQCNEGLISVDNSICVHGTNQTQEFTIDNIKVKLKVLYIFL